MFHSLWSLALALGVVIRGDDAVEEEEEDEEDQSRRASKRVGALFGWQRAAEATSASYQLLNSSSWITPEPSTSTTANMSNASSCSYPVSATVDRFLDTSLHRCEAVGSQERQEDRQNGVCASSRYCIG